MRLWIGLFCWVACANGQNAVETHPFVRSSASATVSARPDRVRLSIGVVTEAKTAQAATGQNASQTEAMLQALHRTLGSTEIHTTGYSVNPNFNAPRNGGENVITGYTASNTVEVTSDDIGNVGKVIDAGMQAGGNNVRGVEFLLKDEGPVRAQALKEAAQKARANAEAMAAALGVRVVRVLSAEEGEPQVVRPVMRAMAAAVTTPIESGNIQVQATVTVALEVGQ